MKIDILCSSEDHPVNAWLFGWASSLSDVHHVSILRDKTQLGTGDILFLVSCTEMIPSDLRACYGYCIVLHASDLPKGRGWSPHVWAVLEGADRITVSAITAEDRIDSGDVWAKTDFEVSPSALHDEINTSLFEAELRLMDRVIEMIEKNETPQPQSDDQATYYSRRTPLDSEIDPDRPISEQFDKIRISDPERYPAYFRIRGAVFEISLRKVQDHD